jgi:hypothetical protein
MKPRNSFTDASFSGHVAPRVEGAFRWYWSIHYEVRAIWRRVRITHWLTRFLGPQYRRSRDLIEIDITYACNLHCLNCNRSVTQAPEALHMPLASVVSFVEESIARGKRWRRIRVLGGEPTVHPEFQAIVVELLRYVRWNPTCIVEVATNGHGPHVEAQLAQLPKTVWVDNSAKTSTIQPHFGPFNMAPLDDARFRRADFRNACFVPDSCGMGLTPTGYYPCAVAGGIDRILGAQLGRTNLPADSDDMLEELDKLCRLCGRFQDGHYVPQALRPALTEARVSPTWAKLYERWRRRRAASSDSVSSESMGSPRIDVPMRLEDHGP